MHGQVCTLHARDADNFYFINYIRIVEHASHSPHAPYPPLSLSPMGRGARVWVSGVCIFAIYLYYARYE